MGLQWSRVCFFCSVRVRKVLFCKALRALDFFLGDVKNVCGLRYILNGSHNEKSKRLRTNKENRGEYDTEFGYIEKY